MTEQELQNKTEAIFNAYAKVRELEAFIRATREEIDEYTGKESFQVEGYAGTYIDRIEDYIRGANATALKNEDPETFAKYGGKTSETRTLRVFKLEQ